MMIVSGFLGPYHFLRAARDRATYAASHEALSLTAALEVYLSDLFKQDAVFTFDLCVPLLNELLILLFVDEHGRRRVIKSYRLHLGQLLPMQREVLFSPFS
jgi:hypothetical protein